MGSKKADQVRKCKELVITEHALTADLVSPVVRAALSSPTLLPSPLVTSKDRAKLDNITRPLQDHGMGYNEWEA